MTKTYKTVELQIVRMNNNDIVTTSNLGVGSNPVATPGQVQTPGRKGIWD